MQTLEVIKPKRIAVIYAGFRVQNRFVRVMD